MLTLVTQRPMKITSLLLGKEFLLSKRLGSDATCEGCELAEWPGKALIKRSSGREPVRSTPLNDSTPDKVLRDIGEDTITLPWKKDFCFTISKTITNKPAKLTKMNKTTSVTELQV